MKKIANLLLITFIFLFIYLTKNINILPLTIGFSMYILFSSLFSTTSIKDVIYNYHNNKNYYLRDKIFKYAVLSIALLGVLLAGISYLIGDLLDIDKLNIINIFMVISLITSIVLKIVNEYIDVIGYKKLSNKLINIYNISLLSILILMSILLFKIFNLNTYIDIIILYLVNVFIFTILVLLIYIFILRKRNKNIDKIKDKNINYINVVQNILIKDKKTTLFNIIKSANIYISIIILYYTLINKYNYSYNNASIIITNTYLYSMIIMYLIYKTIIKYLNINYDNIKEEFNISFNKTIKISLNTCILLSVISVPLNNLLFSTEYNSLIILVPLLFFYIIYNYIVNINIKYNKSKSIITMLVIGLIAAITFEIPFISSVYRMGYSLPLGSILSIVLGFIISIILGLILLRNKIKTNFHDNFNSVLNTTYESIVYALVLVIFTFIVKVDTSGVIESILVIIFYIFITIGFNIIKRIITKK